MSAFKIHGMCFETVVELMKQKTKSLLFFLRNRNHQMQSMMGLAHGTIYWKLIEDMKRGLQPNSPFLWIIQQRFSFKQCIVFTKRDICILNCFLKSPSLNSHTHVQLWSNAYIFISCNIKPRSPLIVIKMGTKFFMFFSIYLQYLRTLFTKMHR